MAFDTKLDVKKGEDKDFSSLGSCKCGKESQVAIAEVINKNTGQIKRGAPSEFCTRDNHNNPTWRLMDFYEFKSHIGYCSDCFSNIKRPGKRRYSDSEVRNAWRWLMGETLKGAENKALAGVFKPVPVTDEQRDLFLEVVNYEAERTGQLEALPDRYRVEGIRYTREGE